MQGAGELSVNNGHFQSWRNKQAHTYFYLLWESSEMQ